MLEYACLGITDIGFPFPAQENVILSPLMQVLHVLMCVYVPDQTD